MDTFPASYSSFLHLGLGRDGKMANKCPSPPRNIAGIIKSLHISGDLSFHDNELLSNSRKHKLIFSAD